MEPSEPSDEEKLLADYRLDPQDEAATNKRHIYRSFSWHDNDSPRRNQLWRLSVSVLALIISLICIAILVFQINSTSKVESYLRHVLEHNGTRNAVQRKQCGLSAAEARENNCRFDLMLTSWVPQDCFDEALMEGYLAKHRYTWYEDETLTKTVPDTVVRRGEHHRVFVENDFHYVHCAYVWEMQMRAYHAGPAMDYEISLAEHTKHCATILVDHVLPRNFTSLTVAFDTCVITSQ